MENEHNLQPQSAAVLETEPTSPIRSFPVGKRELIFGGSAMFFSVLLTGSLLYHGAQLGFCVGAAGLLISSFVYLRRSGRIADGYSAALLVLSLLILVAFPRSDDGVLKFLAICALLTVPGMAFCRMTGKNRPQSQISSVFDGIRTLFSCGLGCMEHSGRGFGEAARSCGKAGKRGGAVALGLLLAIPVVAVLVFLLMRADAAFEGLLDRLPEFQWRKRAASLLLGIPLGFVLYTRTAALHRLSCPAAPRKKPKLLQPLTVNTVLAAVAAVYLVYLGSQLAYFAGGFAGILPADYTLSAYARRGFFEMAWLGSINLLLMVGSMALVSNGETPPKLTRILCLFLGLITLFLVATASAKMLLYIKSYGLTRLRVLTEVFMVWLGAASVFVCIWLLRPAFGYVRNAVVLALCLCAALFWLDVDTCVARYNVRAYQKGALETVDMAHLSTLSAGAVPYLAQLTADDDPQIAEMAEDILKNKAKQANEPELRGWNWAKAQAWKILEPYTLPETAQEAAS